MSAPITHNEEPAEVIPGGLNRASTTLSSTPGKDRTHVFYHDHGAHV